MSRIYHDEHNVNGERTLLFIVCDGCGKRARPGEPKMMASWVNRFTYYSPGDSRNRRSERTFCGDCVPMEAAP